MLPSLIEKADTSDVVKNAKKWTIAMVVHLRADENYRVSSRERGGNSTHMMDGSSMAEVVATVRSAALQVHIAHNACPEYSPAADSKSPSLLALRLFCLSATS